MSVPLLDSEITAPDISHLSLEDETPVDNFQSEKQMRLLVEPLYSSAQLAQPFIAAANVGLFYGLKQDPIVPDVFLSLDVEMPADWSQRQNRSYLFWEFGKPPEVAIEVVSNREGSELSRKKLTYAGIGVAYYAVFDPLAQLQKPDQMNGDLLKVFGLTRRHYEELQPPFWLPEVSLGLTLWEGEFENQTGHWLRWCNQQGEVIPTGKEQAEQQRLRAEQQRLRAEQAEQEVTQERLRAEQAEQEATQERLRAERLTALLQAQGIDPDQV
jgi:Uma2 family endonuclease